MQEKGLTVLITSAGRRGQLVEIFRRDAEELGFVPRIVVAEHRPALSAAAFLADKAYPVSRVTDPGYVDELLEISSREQVQLVVPTIDTELLALAEARPRFSHAGVLVNVSEPPVILCARDKLLTAKRLSDAGVPTPKTGTPAEAIDDVGLWTWPLIFKPRDGSSSVGLKTVPDLTALRTAKAENPHGLVQELLEGPEFTVNMFVTPAGECVSAVPHLRREIRGGEVSKGITVRRRDFSDLARLVATALPGAFGAMCFQAIVGDTGPRVFEINARFGGGFPLTRRAGAPHSRWLMQLAAGLDPDYSDDWADGIWMLRFDDAVFGSITDQASRATWLQ